MTYSKPVAKEEAVKKDEAKPAFFLGSQDMDESSSSEDDSKGDKSLHDKDTQTDFETVPDYKSANGTVVPWGQAHTENDKQPRALEECVAIMNSDVSAVRELVYCLYFHVPFDVLFSVIIQNSDVRIHTVFKGWTCSSY